MSSVIYPIILKYDKEDSVYYVSLPDFINCDLVTYGETISNAVEAAKDVITLNLFDLTVNEYPVPTNFNELKLKDDECVVMVDLWLPYHFSKIKEVYRKKTLSVPTWLDALAVSKNINISGVLQRALKDELGIK